MSGFIEAYKRIAGSLKAGDMGPGNGEHMGEDGYVHCSKCGARRQCYAPMPDGSSVLVWCPCICQEGEESPRYRDSVESARRRCFSGEAPDARFSGRGTEWTEQVGTVRGYAADFESYSRDGMGLILMGGTGTGKTYAADCLLNYLVDSGRKPFKVNFPRAVLDQDFFAADNVKAMTSSDLLVIDDLGAERDTSYMAERVYAVIDSRYAAKRPMVITTNLTAQQMMNPGDQRAARVYSRIMERCYPIAFTGDDRRRRSAAVADMASRLAASKLAR